MYYLLIREILMYFDEKICKCVFYDKDFDLARVHHFFLINIYEQKKNVIDNDDVQL